MKARKKDNWPTPCRVEKMDVVNLSELPADQKRAVFNGMSQDERDLHAKMMKKLGGTFGDVSLTMDRQRARELYKAGSGPKPRASSG